MFTNIFISSISSNTPFPCPFYFLAIALFIYYTSDQTGTEARTEVK